MVYLISYFIDICIVSIRVGNQEWLIAFCFVVLFKDILVYDFTLFLYVGFLCEFVAVVFVAD